MDLHKFCVEVAPDFILSLHNPHIQTQVYLKEIKVSK